MVTQVSEEFSPRREGEAWFLAPPLPVLPRKGATERTLCGVN